MSTLLLKNVGKSFGDKVILKNIDLSIAKGELVTVVGPSGCGKSTLLNGIGGFSLFTTGEALIDGTPIGRPDRNRGIVFQDMTVPEFLTVRENIALGLQFEYLALFQHFIPVYRKVIMRKYRDRVDHLLEQVGLTERADAYPRELSGGQKQRVAIAQAMAMHPKILLMDEPFSALDPQTRQNLQQLVLKVQREMGLTVFFVTHDIEEAVYLGDRIVVLSHLNESTPGARIVLNQQIEAFDTPEAKVTAEFQLYKRKIWDAGFTSHPKITAA
jgi:NitT/TauT family transport system ATP-binding protein